MAQAIAVSSGRVGKWQNLEWYSWKNDLKTICAGIPLICNVSERISHVELLFGAYYNWLIG